MFLDLFKKLYYEKQSTSPELIIYWEFREYKIRGIRTKLRTMEKLQV